VTKKIYPLILNKSWIRVSEVKEIMNMKKLNITLAILVAAVMAGNAQTSVTSEVVGYQTRVAPRGLTPLSLPLVKNPIFAGTVTSKSGTSIALGSVIPVGTSIAKPYYLEVTSGDLAGERVDVVITPGSANVVMNSTSPGNTSNLSTLANGTSVVVREHTTLGDLDSACSPALVGSDDDNVCDRILFMVNGAFVNYMKRSDGWYEDGGYDEMSALPIRPGVGCFLWRKSNTATTLTQVGTVRSNKFARPFNAGYQFYAPAYPLDITPNGMGATSANGWSTGERIHIFANGTFVANLLDTSDTTGGSGGTWYEDGGYDALNSAVLISSSQAALVWRAASSPGIVETSPVSQ
jgi:hypothetical protein